MLRNNVDALNFETNSQKVRLLKSIFEMIWSVMAGDIFSKLLVICLNI